MNITLPTNWYDFFFNWKDYYQGSFNKEPDFSIAWNALPRFVCWKIWNARNKEIFEGKVATPSRIAMKAKVHVKECYATKS